MLSTALDGQWLLWYCTMDLLWTAPAGLHMASVMLTTGVTLPHTHMLAVLPIHLQDCGEP